MFLNRWFVFAFSVIFSLMFALWDVGCHAHYSCHRVKAVVMDQYQSRTHLYKYMRPFLDRNFVEAAGDVSYHEKLGTPGAANLESGIVDCECTEDRKITLTGKVDNPNIRAEFSDIAAKVVGPRNVDNQIEVLNEEALKRLQNLLSKEPTSMTMNYQIRDRGTILLTGDLPNQDLADQIDDMVRSLTGVRTVVNRLGEELSVPMVIRINNIYFDFNKWKIRPESQPRLDEAAQWIHDYLVKKPNGKVEVQGHTDSIASDTYNNWLSQKRAEACVEALVSRGVPREAMTPKGKGESELIVTPDDTPEKRAENRRIEFHFE